jgi:hypothetical protein
MTELQEKLYKHFVESKFLYFMITSNSGGSDSRNALSCILNLKKLLTSPVSIYNMIKEHEKKDEIDISECWDG